MKIVITTGIFDPESGGPATYTPKIAALLNEKGWEVTVITYSDEPRYDFDSKYRFKLVRIVRGNKLVNRVRYFFTVLKYARSCDLIYTLDWFAAGLPVALAAKFLGKKYVVRVGGDYVWEHVYSEISGEVPVTLSDFYERGLYLRGAYSTLYRIIDFILRGGAHIVFNTERQRELYLRFYHLRSDAVSVIYNPVPRLETAGIVRGTPTHEFVYWGRLVVLKNIDSLIRAFAQARLPADYTLAIIGEGPQRENLVKLISELGVGERVRLESAMRLPALFERVKDCRASVVASWTDISPNQIYESMAIHLPELITSENYLSIRDQLPVMIDPRSVTDIAEKLEMLADDARYDDYSRRFDAIVFKQDWDDVLAQHLVVFGTI